MKEKIAIFVNYVHFINSTNALFISFNRKNMDGKIGLNRNI